MMNENRTASEAYAAALRTIKVYETWGIKEAAAFLRIHPDSLARRAKAGAIPGYKVGRAWVFMPDLLAEYLRTKTTERFNTAKIWNAPPAGITLAQRLAAQREQRLAGKRISEAKRLANSKEGDTRDGHGRFLPGRGRKTRPEDSPTFKVAY